MKEKLKEILHHLTTARDGISYSLTKLLGISATGVMCYKFLIDESSDYIGFAGGVAAIMAAMAAKYYVESPEDVPAKD